MPLFLGSDFLTSVPGYCINYIYISVRIFLSKFLFRNLVNISEAAKL